MEVIGIGAAIGAAIIALDESLKRSGKSFRTPVLACAVGIYLPMELTLPIFLGGLIAWCVERRLGVKTEAEREHAHQPGVLFAAGLITGEALMGIVIAIPIAAISLWSSVKGTLAALMPVLLTFISALAITLWALHQGFPDPVRVAVIPVLTLIPGAALTTALIELTAGAMISGSARLVYALVVLLSMAFGLALAIDLVGIGSRNLQDLTTNQAPSWVLWIAPLIFGLGNILYFCPPRRVWFWLVVVAFGTFWINQGLQQVMKPAFAGGVALGIALLVAWAINAHVKGNPSVLVMFLPTFWLMVPGSMGFVAISGAITEDRELSDLGGSAALSLLSMAICMMVASVLAPMVTRRYKAPSAG